MTNSTKKGIMATVAVLVVGYALYAMVGLFGDDLQDSVNTRVFMDKDSGELVTVELKEGVKFFPRENPSTGTMTLYPTEICFKNECKDGEGTRVILNKLIGKEGPTYCPKCGALVAPY